MALETDDVRYLRELCGGDGLRGPGDDAALVEVKRGQVLVTIDPVIEGVHYESGTSATRIGRKLVNRSFSDLAAMGAWPVAVVASLSFGNGWPRAARRRMYRAMRDAIERYEASWVGGDVGAAGAASVFTLCALGEPLGKRPVPRSGMRPGDALFVTGPLGGSFASGRHLDFEPRLEVARRLVADHAPVAMIDVSDGLTLDLSRMLEASGGHGATLCESALPRHRGATLEQALHEGEDHELLFSVRPSHRERVERDPELPRSCRASIGRVEAEPGLRLEGRDGRTRDMPVRGFDHVLE